MPVIPWKVGPRPWVQLRRLTGKRPAQGGAGWVEGLAEKPLGSDPRSYRNVDGVSVATAHVMDLAPHEDMPAPQVSPQVPHTVRTIYDLDQHRWFKDVDPIEHPSVPRDVLLNSVQPRDVREMSRDGEGSLYVPESWDDLGLDESWCEAAGEWLGAKPSTIQKDVIPALLNIRDRDIVFSSLTGTGKTAGYLLALLQQIAKEPKGVNLVIVPSQQLALQVYAWALQWSQKGKLVGRDDKEWLQIHLNDPNEDADLLHEGYQRLRSTWYGGPRLVIAQPGRWADYLLRWRLSLPIVRVVIDEAFTCFKPLGKDATAAEKEARMESPLPADIVMSYYLAFPEWRTKMRAQHIFLTATFTESLERHVVRYLRPDKWMQLTSRRRMPLQIEHSFIACKSGDTVSTLLQAVEEASPPRAVVFVDNNEDIARVHEDLQVFGINARLYDESAAEDGRPPPFLDYEWEVLVMKEQAGYGLDLEGITHVFITHCPTSKEAYCHMAGRTGRFGKPGKVVNIVEEDMVHRWYAHMRLLDVAMECTTVTGEPFAVRPLIEKAQQDLRDKERGELEDRLAPVEEKVSRALERRRSLLYTLARDPGETLEPVVPSGTLQHLLRPREVRRVRTMDEKEIEEWRKGVRDDFLRKAGSVAAWDQREAWMMQYKEERTLPVAKAWFHKIYMRYMPSKMRRRVLRGYRDYLRSAQTLRRHTDRWQEARLLRCIDAAELLPPDDSDPNPGVPPVSRRMKEGAQPSSKWADPAKLPSHPGEGMGIMPKDPSRFHGDIIPTFIPDVPASEPVVDGSPGLLPESADTSHQ